MSPIKIFASAICVSLLAGAIVAIGLTLHRNAHQEQHSFVRCPASEVPRSDWLVYENKYFGIRLDYPATLALKDEHLSTADMSWQEATVAQFTSSSSDSEYIILAVERSDQNPGATNSAHSMTINGIPASESAQHTEMGTVHSFQYQPEDSPFQFDLSLTDESNARISSDFMRMAKSLRLIPKCVALVIPITASSMP